MSQRIKMPGTYLPATIAQFEQARVDAGYTTRTGAPEGFLLHLLKEHTQRTIPSVADFYTRLQLSEQDMQALEAVLASSGMNREDFMRRMIRKELDAYERRTARLYHLDLNDPENRSRRAGAGYQYLREVLQRLMDRNVQAQEWFKQRAVTAERLAKEGGSNPQLARRFMRDHAAIIQEHHEAMGWFTIEQALSHNHKAGNYERNLGREARKAGREDGNILSDVAEIWEDEEKELVP